MSSILDLLQLCDSAIPIGSYAHSCGLEVMIKEGAISSGDDLLENLESVLKFQLGPCDMVFMLAAFRHPDKARYYSDMYSCYKTVKEFRNGSLLVGKRLMEVVSRITDESIRKASLHYPVAFGVSSKHLGIREQTAALGFLYSSISTYVSAAVRLIPLAHDKAQKLLHKTKPLICRVYEEHKDDDPEDAWQFTPQIENAGHNHRKLYTKLFLS